MTSSFKWPILKRYVKRGETRKKSIDSSQSPIFPWDRRDITLLTVEIEDCEQSKRSRDGKTVVGWGAGCPMSPSSVSGLSVFKIIEIMNIWISCIGTASDEINAKKDHRKMQLMQLRKELKNFSLPGIGTLTSATAVQPRSQGFFAYKIWGAFSLKREKALETRLQRSASQLGAFHSIGS